MNNATSQKETERIDGLRRELYLPLADAMAIAQDVPSMLSSVATDRDNYTPAMAELRRHLSKATLVASPEFLIQAQKYYSSLVDLVSDGVQLRFDFDECELLKNHRLQSMNTAAETLKELGEAFKRGENQILNAQRLTQEARNLDNLTKSTQVETIELNNKQLAIQESLHKLITMHHPKVSLEFRAALIALRKEIGLPTDELWFTEYAGNREKFETAVPEK